MRTLPHTADTIRCTVDISGPSVSELEVAILFKVSVSGSLKSTLSSRSPSLAYCGAGVEAESTGVTTASELRVFDIKQWESLEAIANGVLEGREVIVVKSDLRLSTRYSFYPARGDVTVPPHKSAAVFADDESRPF